MSIQWIFAESGSTIGALVALGINVSSGVERVGAPTAMYAVFVVIQAFAMILALTLLVRPAKVVRSDGRNIAIIEAATLKSELKGVVEMIRDYRFMLLLPAIMAAEMALALQSSLNAYYFNLRARSLNNVAFNFIQIPASIGLTYILDNPRFGLRKTRALIGISVMSAVTLGICSAEAAWLAQRKINRDVPGPSVDWSESEFAGGFVIYTIYGSVYR